MDRRTLKRDPIYLSPLGPRGLVPTSEEQMTPVILACGCAISGCDPIRPREPNMTRPQQQLAGRFPGKRIKQAAFTNLPLQTCPSAQFRAHARRFGHGAGWGVRASNLGSVQRPQSQPSSVAWAGQEVTFPNSPGLSTGFLWLLKCCVSAWTDIE